MSFATSGAVEHWVLEEPSERSDGKGVSWGPEAAAWQSGPGLAVLALAGHNLWLPWDVGLAAWATQLRGLQKRKKCNGVLLAKVLYIPADEPC